MDKDLITLGDCILSPKNDLSDIPYPSKMNVLEQQYPFESDGLDISSFQPFKFIDLYFDNLTSFQSKALLDELDRFAVDFSYYDSGVNSRISGSFSSEVVEKVKHIDSKSKNITFCFHIRLRELWRHYYVQQI